MFIKNLDAKLTLLYESDGLFSKIIDTPAEEAIKNGFDVTGTHNPEVIDFLLEALDELDWEETAMTGIRWARLFGGAIAIMLINDGGNLEDTVDWQRIVSVDGLIVYDRSVVQPSGYALDPEFFIVTNRSGCFKVHKSRCLVFRNHSIPEFSDNSIHRFWGIPEFYRIQTAMQHFKDTQKSTIDILHRFTQPVYKMKNLSEVLTMEGGEKFVWKRLETIDAARSFYRSIMIDAAEDYDFLTVPLTGISEITETMQTLLSAVTCIPKRILFGKDVKRNAFGLEMSHSYDKCISEDWYNYVQGIQMRMLKPNLICLLKVLLQAAYNTGEIDEIPKISIKFRPLWSMSELEQAEAEYKRAVANLRRAEQTRVYYQMGAMSKKEILEKGILW